MADSGHKSRTRRRRKDEPSNPKEPGEITPDPEPEPEWPEEGQRNKTAHNVAAIDHPPQFDSSREPSYNPRQPPQDANGRVYNHRQPAIPTERGIGSGRRDSVTSSVSRGTAQPAQNSAPQWQWSQEHNRHYMLILDPITGTYRYQWAPGQ